ncbi:hypothetical protein [Nesterenkonia alba]|uniref:hypothetical protein n=1 Tax=Nesterenkonia alba TaxID=515814 RepID=UPI0003B4B47C|nr:hypothetical protein [Nesterenkonia alba]
MSKKKTNKQKRYATQKARTKNKTPKTPRPKDPFSGGTNEMQRRFLERDNRGYKFLPPRELYQMLCDEYEKALSMGKGDEYLEYISKDIEDKCIQELKTDFPGAISWTVVDEFLYKGQHVGGACKDWVIAIEQFKTQKAGGQR